MRLFKQCSARKYLLNNRPLSTCLLVLIRYVFILNQIGNLWSYCCLNNRSEYVIEGDILVCDDAGKVLVEVNGIVCQAIHSSKYSQRINSLLYQYYWKRSAQRLPMRFSNFVNGEDDNTLMALQGIASETFCDGDRRTYYEDVEPLFTELTCHYLLSTLETIDIFDQGDVFSIDQIMKKGHLLSKYQRFLTRSLQILQEAGAVTQLHGELWHLSTYGYMLRNRQTLAEKLRNRVLEQYRIEVELLSLCGDNLWPVLKGERDPVDLIFSNAHITQYFISGITDIENL